MRKKHLLYSFLLASALGMSGEARAKFAWDFTTFSDATMQGVMNSWYENSYGWTGSVSDSLLAYNDPETGALTPIAELSSLSFVQGAYDQWGLNFTEGDTHLFSSGGISSMSRAGRICIRRVSANALITIVTERSGDGCDKTVVPVDTNMVSRVEGNANPAVGERVTNVFQVNPDAGDNRTVEFYVNGYTGVLKIYSVTASDMSTQADALEVIRHEATEARAVCDSLGWAGLTAIQAELTAKIEESLAVDTAEVWARDVLNELMAAVGKATGALEANNKFGELISQSEAMVAERPDERLSAAITDAHNIYDNRGQATAETLTQAYLALRTAKNVYVLGGKKYSDFDFNNGSGYHFVDGGIYNFDETNKVAQLIGLQNDANVTEFDVPETVEYEGEEYAVVGLSSAYNYTWLFRESLQRVSLPATLMCIGGSVFNGCEKLEYVEIPALVTEIGAYAFNECRSLTNVTLPAALDSLGSYAFRYCESLGSITVPEKIKAIGEYTFAACSSLREVSLPAGLEKIGNYAFSSCTALESITLPDEALTEIGEYAFDNCESLTAIHLPAALQTIGNYAFRGCSALKELVLPAALQSVGYGAFSSVELLKLTSEAMVPPTLNSGFNNLYVVYVSDGAGEAYRAAETWKGYIIVEGEGVSLSLDISTPGTLGQQVLDNVENMEDVNYLTLSGSLNDDDIYNIQERLTGLVEIDLSGTDMTAMPSQMFYQRHALQGIVLPAGLRSIGSEAMYGCTSLRRIELPATLDSIEYRAFYGCSALEAWLEIPEGVTMLDQYAFANCSSLESVYIRSSQLKTISHYAFSGATKLGMVAFCEGLEEIGDGAFTGAEAMTSVNFPSTLRKIGNSAFSGCSNMSWVTLPASVTSCGYLAFDSNVQNVTCLSLLPPELYSGNTPVGGMTDGSTRTLYVPSLSVVDYKLTEGWDQFDIKGIDQLPENITVHSDYTLNLPDTALMVMNRDSVLVPYKPNLAISRNDAESNYAALTVNGSQTLSMGRFSMWYDIYDAGRYSDEASCYNSLVSNAPMRADSVETRICLLNERWNFLSFPYDVKVGDIVPADDNTSWVIRRYDGAARARSESGTTWADMTRDSVLHAGVGYIWQAYRPSESYSTFDVPAENGVNKNLIFAAERRTVALEEHLAEFSHNRSWNLVGNPYPCFYDTRYMEFTAPFTVWNYDYQTYEAYSPMDDAYILRPGEAFFVQRPVELGEIGFPTEGRQTDLTVRETAVANLKAAPARGSRVVFNLFLSDGERKDRTRFVINEAASAAYDMVTDAGKFGSTDKTMAQLFTIEGGVDMAINERPMGNGRVKLGAYFGKSGNYSITLDTRSAAGVTLVDHLTGKTADLTAGEYTFQAEAGADRTRFEVVLDGTATSIGGVGTDGDNVVAAAAGAIVVEAGGVADITVYTVDGKTVASASAASARFDVAPGLYIVAVGDNRYKVTVNR